MDFNITFGYKKKKPIFENFMITVPDCKITILCGHNGAGKTTLLKNIAGVFPSESSAEDAWFVSAGGGLISHFSLNEHLKMMSVYDEIKKYGLLKEAFEVFEASDFADRRISKLSTGQVMMASIIVAIASKKRFLLLDEPFGCLDPSNASNLSHLLKRMTEEKITVLATSHDLFMTAETADNVVFIKNGQIVFTCSSPSDIEVEKLMEEYRTLC